MKKEQRDRIINDLLTRARSKDYDEQQHALFQIALMFERSIARDNDAADIYTDNLDRYMLRMSLGDDEQSRLIEGMTSLAARDKGARGAVFWAMGKGKPSLMVDPLVALLRTAGATFDPNTAYEAVTALRDLLVDEATIAQAREGEIIELLQTWAESKNERLSRRAGTVLNIIKPNTDDS